MTALGQGLKITYLLAPFDSIMHVDIMWDHWFSTLTQREECLRLNH